MPSRITFGEQLRIYRRHHHLTQVELAAHLGYVPSTIRKLETGLRRPTRALVALLADLFALDDAERAALLKLAADFSPTRRTPQLSGPDALLGRDADLRAAAELLAAPAHRLVTLLGPGGVGKTRLARALTERLSTAFHDGTAWVALADVVDARQVPAAIMAGLGLRPSARQTSWSAVCAELATRQLLLVLDNFEHVRVAAQLLPELLAVAPGVTLLITSRVALDVADEQRYALAPLAVPGAGEPLDAALIERWPATALFLARTRAIVPALELTADTARAIGAICRRLDGLPLALELAAANSGTLSPAALADQIAAHWDLLALSHRQLPARHRTLWTMLDWSYCLLAPAAQRFLCRLSVFAGGWTEAAAVAVCCDADVPDTHAPALLRALVDHSLIQLARGEGEPRYSMLATVQAFARTRLAEARDEQPLRERHAAYFAEIAAAADATFNSAAISALRREEANLQVALRYALDAANSVQAMQVATNIAKFWMNDGRLAEGRWWLEQVLERTTVKDGPDLARVAGMLGGIAWRQGDTVAARHALQTSLDLYVAAGDQENEAWLAINLAKVECDVDRFAVARQLIARAIEVFEARSDMVGLGWTRLFEGEVWFREGYYAEARACFAAAVTPFEATERSLGVAYAYMHLGETALAQRDRRQAMALLRSSLELLAEYADQSGIAACLEGLARCLLAAPQLSEPTLCHAAMLLAHADLIRSNSGFVVPPRLHAHNAEALARVRAGLGEAAFTAAWRSGQAASVADLVSAMPPDSREVSG